MTTESNTTSAAESSMPIEMLPLAQGDPPGEGESYAYRFPGHDYWQYGHADVLDVVRAALDKLSDDAPYATFETAIVRPATHLDVPIEMIEVVGDIKTRLQEAALKFDRHSHYLDTLSAEQSASIADMLKRALHESFDDLEVPIPAFCTSVRAIKLHTVSDFVPSSIEQLKMLAKGGLYSDSAASRTRLQADLERVFGLTRYERASVIFERAVIAGKNKVDKIISAYEELRELIAHHD